MTDENTENNTNTSDSSDANDFHYFGSDMMKWVGEQAQKERELKHKDKVDAMTFKLLSILKADRFTDHDIADVIAKMNTLIVIPNDETKR